MINEPFIEKFEKFALTHRLFKEGDTLLVGFSGGSDSTALILVLHYLIAKYRFKLMAAHVNYHLRGEESNADAEFVKQFCFERNIGVLIKDAPIEASAGVEALARNIRFDFFQQTAKNYGAKAIVLGHNKGDQAETVIFRIARGTGFTGLKGILPRSGNIIHPLLSFSRHEIDAFLMNYGIIYRTDSSNASNEYTRNKIRNHLIPWIEDNLNPRIVDKLASNAAIFYEMEQILQHMTESRIKSYQYSHDEDSIDLSIKKIIHLFSVQRFYIYRFAYVLVHGDEADFYANHAAEIDKIIRAKSSKYIRLSNNVYVRKEYDHLIFYRQQEEIDVHNQLELPSVRGKFKFENHLVSMKKIKKLPGADAYQDAGTIYLDYDKIIFPLIIRHRQAGDKFIPFGMQKQKKLKDFFIDEKVSLFDRNGVLVFADSEKIIWIAGYRADNRACVVDDTKQILKISIEHSRTRKRYARRKK